MYKFVPYTYITSHTDPFYIQVVRSALFKKYVNYQQVCLIIFTFYIFSYFSDWSSR